jgi:hypothetical protein
MARKLGASDAGVEVSEGCRPVGVGAQGRAGERRAQPRQVAGRERLPGPAPRQRQHLGLLTGGHRAHGAGRLRHRALHRRRPGRRPARCRRPGAPRPRWRATWTCSTPGRSTPSRPPRWRCAARRARWPPAGRSPIPKAPACRRSSRTSGPATRGASAAAMPVRATTCRCRRSPGAAAHAARQLVHVDARRGRAGRAGAVGRYAAERALSRLKPRRVPTAEVPVLFESTVAAGLLGSLRAGHLGRCAVPQGQLPARQPGHSGAARAHRRGRGPARAQGQGQRAVRRRGRAHAAPRAWSMPAWCRATSCRAIRRASWA